MPLLVERPTNRFILGLMTFGPLKEKGGRITDIETFNEALTLFQSRGYSEVDTAPVYVGGEQEAFTRETGWKQRGLQLATKVRYPLNSGDNTPEKVQASVERSLKALATDCVDILYLHRADRGTPFAHTLEALDRLHRAGKFVQLGLSNFTAYEVAEVVMTCKYNGWVRPTIYQGMYNCITRHIETELNPACRRYDMDIVMYNPIAGGLFSGKIKSKDLVPAEGRFSNVDGFSGPHYRSRYFRDGTFEALQILEKAAEEHGLSMIEIALRWMVHHSQLRIKDGNDGVIIGVSSVEQLGDNLDNLEKGPLPEAVVKALDEAWNVSKTDSIEYFHGKPEYDYDTAESLFGAGAK